VRFPREIIDKDRTTLGPRAFAAQHQQNPSPEGGLLFKDVLAHRWIESGIGRTIVTVDCSFKGGSTNDHVAIQTWRRVGRNYHLLARVNRIMGATETAKAIFAMATEYPDATVYVEDKANGPALIDLFSHALPQLTPWDPGKDSKYTRAQAKAHLFEEGRVLLPPDHAAPWVVEYAAEVQRFPLAPHDDDVDATTMALMILDDRSNGEYEAAVAALYASIKEG
jgi:predicted phage terminase large subunit-like protein